MPGSRVDAVTQVLEAAGASAIRLEEALGPAIYDEGLAEEPRYWPLTGIAAFFVSEGACRFAAEVLKGEAQDVRCEFVSDEGWERRAQEDWQPLPIIDTLWIYPNGVEAPADRDVVHLDPGLAFGTGTHPTTRLCLQWLYRTLAASHRADRDILDFGCGSGILAIAALRLGARCAYAVDIDPLAVTATQENAIRNRVADRLHVSEGPLTLKHPYALVVANILAGPLVIHSELLARAVATGGQLALSGILENQVDRVTAAFPDFSLSIAREEDWCLLHGGRR